MTERKDDPEAAEEQIEDLEAPASQQENVVGGLPPQCHITDCQLGTDETTIII